MKRQMAISSMIITLLMVLHPTLWAAGGAAWINGKMDQPIHATIALFQIKNGETYNTTTCEVYPQDRGFLMPVATDAPSFIYLYISTKSAEAEEKEGMKKVAVIPLFVKPNEQLNLTIHLESKEAGLVKGYSIQKPSPENAALRNWYIQSRSIVMPWKELETPMEPAEYFQLYNKQYNGLKQLAGTLGVQGNKAFSYSLTAMAEAQLNFSPIWMYLSHKEWREGTYAQEVNPYLSKSFERLKKFCKSGIFGAGMAGEINLLYDALYHLELHPKITENSNDPINRISDVSKSICNDTLKGAYITNKLRGITKTAPADFENELAPYSQYLVLPFMKQVYDAKLQELKGNGSRAQPDPVKYSQPAAISLPSFAKNLSVITGIISHSGIRGDIFLQSAAMGRPINVMRQRTGMEDNRFFLAASISSPGFYFVSTGQISFRVYLKPGETLEVDLTKESTQMGLPVYSYKVLQGSNENKWLQQWFQQSLPVTHFGHTNLFTLADTTGWVTFTKAYQNANLAAKDYLNNLNSFDANFNRMAAQAVQLDLEYGALSFLAFKTDRVRAGIPSTFRGFNLYPSLYDSLLEPAKFCTTDVLKFREGAAYIDFYLKLKMAAFEKQTGKKIAANQRFPFLMESLCNDSVRSAVILQNLDHREITNLTEFNQKYLPVKPWLVQENTRKKYEDIYAMFAMDTLYLGRPALPINLPDSNGNTVNVNEAFKGKVVFIDTWATWCGPCREQFPFLKQLEHDYANEKDIVFIGISVDRERDKEKWKKMIRTENLPGLQLLDEGGKYFREPLQIESIPRFLLMDKQGNWVEVRCPKPDTGAYLKKYIDGALGRG